jgi:hypothetical protein
MRFFSEIPPMARLPYPYIFTLAYGLNDITVKADHAPPDYLADSVIEDKDIIVGYPRKRYKIL